MKNLEQEFKGDLSPIPQGLLNLTECEYYVLSELISMPDRKLAHAIELDLFAESHSANPERLKLYLEAMGKSECEQDFAAAARFIAKQNPAPFVQNKL